MGLYINPRTDTDARSKANTILAAGKRVDRDTFRRHKPGADDLFGVALIDNGFIAAGVAYSKGEAEAFAHPRTRAFAFVMLSRSAIAEMDPSCAEALK